jgi:hypothetical protein
MVLNVLFFTFNFNKLFCTLQFFHPRSLTFHFLCFFTPSLFFYFFSFPNPFFPSFCTFYLLQFLPRFWTSCYLCFLNYFKLFFPLFFPLQFLTFWFLRFFPSFFRFFFPPWGFGFSAHRNHSCRVFILLQLGGGLLGHLRNTLYPCASERTLARYSLLSPQFSTKSCMKRNIGCVSMYFFI